MATTDERLLVLEARVEALEAKAKAGGARVPAVDVDIDNKHGDPVVRRDPSAKYWPGESFAGKRLSQCSPEYLEAFAKHRGASAFMKRKEGGEQNLKYASYDELDAARALKWAERLRGGWKPPAGQAEAERYGTSGAGASAKHAAGYEPTEDELPF